MLNEKSQKVLYLFVIGNVVVYNINMIFFMNVVNEFVDDF